MQKLHIISMCRPLCTASEASRFDEVPVNYSAHWSKKIEPHIISSDFSLEEARIQAYFIKFTYEARNKNKKSFFW